MDHLSFKEGKYLVKDYSTKRPSNPSIQAVFKNLKFN